MKTISFPSTDRHAVAMESIIIAVDGLLDVTVTAPARTIKSIKEQADAAGDDYIDYLRRLAFTVDKRSVQFRRAQSSIIASKCDITHRKASP